MQVLSGSALLDDVTLDGNYAADAGAVNALYAAGWQAEPRAQIEVRSSSLVNNGVPACFADGVSFDTWSSTTTIDADDPSCVGTQSTADTLSTAVTGVYADPAQPKMGGPVGYHATVTKLQSGSEDLAGTLTFHVEGQDPVTVVVPASGQVSATAVAPGTADYTVRAVYSGSQGYRGSQSGIVTVHTDGAASSLALDAATDTDPGWYRGHPLTLTATVTSGANWLVPTGEVEFFGGGDSLGTAQIGADGRAVLETAITSGDAGSFGYWSLHAAYAGDTQHDASGGDLDVYLAADGTTLTLTPSKPLASAGDTVTFTAKVTSNAPGSPAVGVGSVTLSGLSLQTKSLNAQGEAVFTVSGLTYGTYPVIAQYSGAAGRFTTSSDTIDYAVTGTVASSVGFARGSTNRSYPGDAVSFLVYVNPAGGVPVDGLPNPTGTVRLMQGDVALAEGTLPNLSVSNLPLGVNDLRIEYSGDSVYLPSSVNVQQTVQKVPTSMYFTRSTSTSVIGQPVQFNVFVNTSAIGQISQPVTSGEVRVSYDGSLVGTIDLSQGSTLIAALPPSIGSGTLILSYQGDDYYASSSAPADTHLQSKATAAVELEFVQSEVPYVGTVEATVRVTGVAPSAEQPQTGAVQLMSDGAPIAGVAAVQIAADGTARFSPPFPLSPAARR